MLTDFEISRVSKLGIFKSMLEFVFRRAVFREAGLCGCGGGGGDGAGPLRVRDVAGLPGVVGRIHCSWGHL